MGKIKIISEYTNDTYYNGLTDSLNEKVEQWVDEFNGNIEIVNVSTNLTSLKEEDDTLRIVMIANIVYKEK